jgi:hypothetical protein
VGRVLAFCDNFQIVGIGKLLLTDDPEPLHWHLHQSGAAFAHFLGGPGQEPPPSSKFRSDLNGENWRARKSQGVLPVSAGAHPGNNPG